MSADVRQELEGIRAEHPDEYPDTDAVVLQEVDRVSRFDERKASTANDPKDYFLSTELNFRHALKNLSLDGTETVLELGAEHDFPFLQPFVKRGCRCFATNIFYRFSRSEPPQELTQVVLGDMNRLPYRSNTFDVVLASATTHHSPDLPGLIREMARVTRPGGRILILNDPSSGLLKHLFDRLSGWSRQGGHRNAMIHENEYSPLAYRRLARANGLDLTESFFSVYYDQKLTTGQVSGVRFSGLARLMARAWTFRPVRDLFSKHLLLPCQLLIGVEINMIFRKARQPRPAS